MSIYKRVEEILMRDYEVVRLLTHETINIIIYSVMEELRDYEDVECTDQFIHQMIGETIRKLIAKGVENERNINKSI